MWNDKHLGDRPYQPEHVNTLQRAVSRNLSRPHRFICVADSAQGFSKDVEVFITPPEAREVGMLRSPEGGRFPSCYRRLWNFSEGAKAFGEKILCIDIDLVPTGDWGPLFDRDEDFVGWRPLRDWGRKLRFGGGIYLLKPGTRKHLWDGFKGPQSIAEARAAGMRGSDQAWISHKLGAVEPYYARDAGIYSIRDLHYGTVIRAIKPKKIEKPKLPSDARLVQFNGPQKPWACNLSWVAQHWH